MFRDRVKIAVRSGNGGNGSAHLRHEKFVPRGGPDGGDGGRGGDVFVQAVEGMNTLFRYSWNQRFSAENGGNGRGQRKHGKAGVDLTLEVPPGTQVFDEQTGELLADLAAPSQQVRAARGGRGGLGNTHFSTATHQTPRYADRGEPGTDVTLLLELKLIADVGLVGQPNAGKSTFLSVVSAARPKIADYPFTTLEPNLGVVDLDEQTFVVADIPGLIEGAHAGAGLGHEFLRHVERTLVLIHVLDASSGDLETILGNFDTINEELRLYGADLAERPQVVAVNKMDLPAARDVWPTLRPELERRGHAAYAISAATGEGLLPVLRHVWRLLAEERTTAREGSATADEPASDAELPLITPRGADADDVFAIQRIPSGFRVRGRRAERIVAMTSLETFEGIERLQEQLRRAGITRALERSGVKDGDQVYIGDVNFEWGERPPPERQGRRRKSV